MLMCNCNITETVGDKPSARTHKGSKHAATSVTTAAPNRNDLHNNRQTKASVTNRCTEIPSYAETLANPSRMQRMVHGILTCLCVNCADCTEVGVKVELCNNVDDCKRLQTCRALRNMTQTRSCLHLLSLWPDLAFRHMRRHVRNKDPFVHACSFVSWLVGNVLHN